MDKKWTKELLIVEKKVQKKDGSSNTNTLSQKLITVRLVWHKLGNAIPQ